MLVNIEASMKLGFFCGNDREFMMNWPTLMSLWQVILVIPTHVDVWECGFLKQNLV
jgi:hypothetical protein